MLGATIARASPAELAAAERFGRALGLAFQLTDDALDLAGDAATLGKATGKDLAEGVYSLPVLATVQSGDADARRLRALLDRAWLTPDEVAEAVALVRAGPAVAAALDLARSLAAEAAEAAQALPGPARSSLTALSERLVARTS